MKQKCKICGANAESSYCFRHRPRKPLKSGDKPTLTTKNKVNASKTQQMREFFMTIWNKRPHVSEISGEVLFSPPSSAYFHHILPKSKYPNLCLKEDNIILLAMDEHANVESDIYRYEEVNKRRNHLLEKYKIV